MKVDKKKQAEALWAKAKQLDADADTSKLSLPERRKMRAEANAMRAEASRIYA